MLATQAECVQKRMWCELETGQCKESGLQRSQILHMIALEKCFPLPGCQGGSFVFKPNEAYLSYLISFSFDILKKKIGALLFPNADF